MQARIKKNQTIKLVYAIMLCAGIGWCGEGIEVYNGGSWMNYRS
jgi:uncharacterized membrane protein